MNVNLLDFFRSSSVYTIVDKIMSTVAQETLTDERDRKWFLDTHRYDRSPFVYKQHMNNLLSPLLDQ